MKPVPDLRVLTESLEAAFSRNGSARIRLAAVQRRRLTHASTFPSELVTCRFEDGRKKRVVCKFAARRAYHVIHGHRGGVAYEAEVYRHILDPLPLTKPKYYGFYRDPAGRGWLVLEYIAQACRIQKGPYPTSMERAAAWIGRFHAFNERRIRTNEVRFLNRYDAKYYEGWIERTARFVGTRARQYPWIKKIRDRAGRFIELLVASPRTVIHGEYTPSNGLYLRGRVYPLDWESAAVAAGEIDLAGLLDGDWPASVVRRCTLSYQQARWPEGPPDDFEQRFRAARLYWAFHWLGDRPGWPSPKDRGEYLAQAHSAAESLGLL